ncbi:hypothetical protein POSPLADRAFT_1048692 [Postia placenta MAD-698-R-SB12]|uniref:DUF6699 domain-containing protein n=1 Tax=Postia placenta MAD-698-R-SB12 TaxID=670580 RepID=A0A1X6MSJ3_9APHY|nr:hypothetical protein POSPLADRAFT_1048692 [Postia placenta MAD-698-R-SB12]OSX59355.1 hypothetical protein POSPLADRAFT_1048692 [Postia placenta MAD-698-R-SB12]
MPGMAPPPNPAPFPSPPMLVTPLPPMVPLGPPQHMTHQRRRSDGNLPQPAWYPWGTYPAFVAPPYMYQQPQPQPQPAPSPQLHPMLNGEGRDGPALLFDVSVHTFQPMRLTSAGASSGPTLSLDELGQQATYPPCRRMKISCDIIPQWPIELEAKEQERTLFLSIPSNSHKDAPITVGDVLIAIHRSLQRQISHVDWARLSQAEETAVARAYTRRCKTYGSVEAFEKSQGVRRVDYLLDKYMFRGLISIEYGIEYDICPNLRTLR